MARMASPPVLWTAADVARIAGGAVVGAWAATGVSLAPGRCAEGDLYIDLRDGEAVPAAYARGAAACATHRQIEGVPAWNHPDLAAGLAALGQAARDRCGAVRIGVPDASFAELLASVAAIAGPVARLAARDEALANLSPGAARAIAPVSGAGEAARIAPHILILRAGADPEHLSALLLGLPVGGIVITEADAAGLSAVQREVEARGLELLCWQATGEAAAPPHARVLGLSPEPEGARVSVAVFGEALEVMLPASALRPASLEALLSGALALAVSDISARLSLPHLAAGIHARAEPRIDAPTTPLTPVLSPAGAVYAV